jgi:hypothetical protein
MAADVGDGWADPTGGNVLDEPSHDVIGSVDGR